MKISHLVPPVAPAKPTVLVAHGDERIDSYIWLLNNDTVVHTESLKSQISYLEMSQNSKIGILGSKLIYYYKQDTLQAVGGKFDKNFYISSVL